MDDYMIDIELGEWILSLRNRRKITIYDVSKTTGLSPIRIESLERGFAEKGITKKEIDLIAKAYRIDPIIITKKALRPVR